jgi:MinD superfamily P-loop ATPase
LNLAKLKQWKVPTLKDTGSDSLKVVICSGKGGTGKTTLALSMAWTLGRAEGFSLPVKLLDCDVEEPNCHLFLRGNYDTLMPVLAEKPVFDMQLCNGCGRCSNKCRYNAIAVVKGKPLVFNDLCHSCGVCGVICPRDAISLKAIAIGEVLADNNHRPFSFMFGRLNVGESQSPMVIGEMLKHALPDGLNIIDGPPGTACNTVKAIAAADKVILVTEPTPFGANDLALALDLCAQLQKPCAIVINRSDSNDQLIENLAESYQVSVVGKIPFKREYARACSDGLILTEEFPELRAGVISSFSRLLSEAAVPLTVKYETEARGECRVASASADTQKSDNYQEITVLSGKGGTGKTTVTGAFVALADSLVAADCDVDAANLRLIMNEKILYTERACLGSEAVIDQRKCTKCDKCFEACRFGAIDFDKQADRYSVNALNCEGCGLCIEICPAKAISEKRAETGSLMLSESTRGQLVHAKLAPAAENSGKLVSMVRSLAFAIVDQQQKEWLLVDGPPGTACPAIASVTGSDRVILVTEPTIAAVHDLERIIKLVRHFGLKPEIIINKVDINPTYARKIRDLADNAGYKILGEIPFDDTVKEAIKAGVPVVDFNDGPASQALRTIWNKIKETR